jgi:hypothetical protein
MSQNGNGGRLTAARTGVFVLAGLLFGAVTLLCCVWNSLGGTT